MTACILVVWPCDHLELVLNDDGLFIVIVVHHVVRSTIIMIRDRPDDMVTTGHILV